MVKLPLFTDGLSNGHLGAERPPQVKPHTAKGVQDPQRTTQSDGILQLLLGLGLLRPHTLICCDRLTQTHTYLTQSDNSLLLLC